MNKTDKKVILARFIALLVVLLIAAAMFIIGRGHTVYFDNKSTDLSAKTGKVPYSIEVYVKGEKVAKLKDGERGMVDIMGQSLKMQLAVTEEKGGTASKMNVTLPIPYDKDGVIINLPALLARENADVYMTEFVPTPPADDTEDVVMTDEAGEIMNMEQ